MTSGEPHTSRLKIFGNFLGGIVKKIPIIGGLLTAPKKAHTEALSENGLAVFFAGLPVIAPLFVAFLIPNFSVYNYLNKLLGEGELFLYACAFVGPLIYAVGKDRKPTEESFVEGSNGTGGAGGFTLVFPYALWFITISVLLCGLSLLAYALLRLSPLGEHASENQKYNVFIASFITYIIAILCLYSASVYRNVLEYAAQAPKIMREDERGFSNQWRRR